MGRQGRRQRGGRRISSKMIPNTTDSRSRGPAAKSSRRRSGFLGAADPVATMGGRLAAGPGAGPTATGKGGGSTRGSAGNGVAAGPDTGSTSGSASSAYGPSLGSGKGGQGSPKGPDGPKGPPKGSQGRTTGGRGDTSPGPRLGRLARRLCRCDWPANTEKKIYAITAIQNRSSNWVSSSAKTGIRGWRCHPRRSFRSKLHRRPWR